MATTSSSFPTRLSSTQSDDHSSGGPVPPGFEEWPDRQSRPREWWGQQHPVPPPGHTDRIHLFARPNPMSPEEKARIISRWNATVREGGTGKVNGLAHHLRPSTPRVERAEGDIKRLQAMGLEVSPEARQRILAHRISNGGLIESLQNYCEGKKHVSVAYVNELIMMIDRLMLECATQADVASKKHHASLEQQTKEFLKYRESFGKERDGRKRYEASLREQLQALQTQPDAIRIECAEAKQAAGAHRHRQTGNYHPMLMLRAIMRVFWSLVGRRALDAQEEVSSQTDQEPPQTSEADATGDLVHQMNLMYP